nr:CTF-II=cytotoxic factor [Trimeresurus flavoviridis=habu, venom, Peptide Partial, 18 aa] [Protobothrops flavoviridis]
ELLEEGEDCYCHIPPNPC